MNSFIHKSDKVINFLLEKKFNKIKTSNLNEIDKIKLFDNLLNQISSTRKIINTIKREKDQLIKNYILNTKIPNILEIDKLTYKALLMYFRDTFINQKIELNFLIYEKDNKLNSSKLKEFFPQDKMPLKVYLTNFPHLIGIKKEFLGNSNKVI